MKHIVLHLLLSLSLQAASWAQPARIEVLAGTYQTSYPVLGFPALFYKAVHPGIQVGCEKSLYSYRFPDNHMGLGIIKGDKHPLRHDWLGRAQVGFFYHRFLQAGLPLKLELVYRHTGFGHRDTSNLDFLYGSQYKWPSRLEFELALGIGYLHSFVLTDTYQLQSDGSYEKVYQLGRPQAILTFTPGLSYGLGRYRDYFLLLRYQIALQLPFVSGFVPVLPYNILQVGISRNFFSNRPLPDNMSR